MTIGELISLYDFKSFPDDCIIFKNSKTYEAYTKPIKIKFMPDFWKLKNIVSWYVYDSELIVVYVNI